MKRLPPRNTVVAFRKGEVVTKYKATHIDESALNNSSKTDLITYHRLVHTVREYLVPPLAEVKIHAR